MKICGVEIQGSDAVICLLTKDNDVFTIPDCRARSVVLSKSERTDSMQKFHFTFKKLMEDYGIEQIALIERAQKGKFAGSAASFKIEAALQLCDLPLELIKQTEIKEQLKRNPPHADFEGLGIKRFQKGAFEVAYALQNRLMYSSDDGEE